MVRPPQCGSYTRPGGGLQGYPRPGRVRRDNSMQAGIPPSGVRSRFRWGWSDQIKKPHVDGKKDVRLSKSVCLSVLYKQYTYCGCIQMFIYLFILEFSIVWEKKRSSTSITKTVQQVGENIGRYHSKDWVSSAVNTYQYLTAFNFWLSRDQDSHLLVGVTVFDRIVARSIKALNIWIMLIREALWLNYVLTAI